MRSEAFCDSIFPVTQILLLTAESLPHDDPDTPMVADALRTLGVEADIVPWTDSRLPEMDADLMVIRTTWDYTERLADFLDLLGSLSTPVVNGLDVVRWNCHKGYLTELAAAGVPTVRTRLYRRGDTAVLPDFGTAEIIVKPAVSAGARGVGRFRSGASEAVAHLSAILTTGDALVQPYQPEVVAGERSLMFMAGVYTHAVRKTPVHGEFRVQEQYGGINEPHPAAAAELAVAAAALAQAPGGADGLLYARIDLVGSETEPLVMELELIEPDLFLSHAPGSVELLARAIIARLDRLPVSQPV